MPEVQEVAETHGTTPAQASLAWLVAKDGVVTIPEASDREHLESNLAAADRELAPEEHERVDGISEERKLFK